jgi:hypothetical protein
MISKKDPNKKEFNETSDNPQQTAAEPSMPSHFNFSGNVAGGLSVGGQSSSDLDLFIQVLSSLLERHGKGRSPLMQLFHNAFRGKKEINKVSSMVELSELIHILIQKDFYKTSEKEKQKKYIKLMLNYLGREVPDDYSYLLMTFLPETATSENISALIRLSPEETQENISRLIMQRLVGDFAVDANLPAVSQKTETIICPTCGHRLIEAYRFCPVCGKEVISASQNSPETSETAQPPVRVSFYQRILNRLAGDTTTSAPSPDVSKKKKGKGK